jgi:hypothetical protein
VNYARCAATLTGKECHPFESLAPGFAPGRAAGLDAALHAGEMVGLARARAIHVLGAKRIEPGFRRGSWCEALARQAHRRE